MSDLESDFAKECDATDAEDRHRTNRPGLHLIKSHPRCFEQSLQGKKKYELRRNDRDYREGDELLMHEHDPERGREREADGYTGRWLGGRVTHVTRSEDAADGGLLPGYVVLGVQWKSAGAVG